MIGWSDITNLACKYKHVSLFKMDDGDWFILLGNIFKTKCAYIKPSLKNIEVQMAKVKDHQVVLFKKTSQGYVASM